MDLLAPEKGLLIWNVVSFAFVVLIFYILYLVIMVLRKKLRE
jgi:hypothetical protein